MRQHRTESRRRTALLNKPGWEIGFELAGGWHSGFAQIAGTLPSWSIQGSYSHAWYAGFASPFGDTGRPPHSDRLTLGPGWYQ